VTPAVAAGLQRTVEVEPAPEVARNRLVVLGTLILTLVLAAAIVWVTRSHDDREQTLETPPAEPPASVPDPPAPLSAGGAYTLVDVLPSDDLAVQQWIRGATPISGLEVAAPRDPLLPSGAARATRLRIVADGVRIPSGGPVDTTPRLISFLGSTSVYLSYTLSGALERAPGREGRALARVTSLDVTYRPPPVTESISFRGAQVLSLACTPRGADLPPEPCGVQKDDAWQVRLPAAQGYPYRVMAQLDVAD
jgi:hypothetical protein